MTTASGSKFAPQSVMRHPSVCRLLVLAVLISVSMPSRAAEEGVTVGVRAGVMATDNNEDFTQYEVFLHYGLPWRWRWDSGWALATRLHASLGVLDADSGEGLIATLGPGVVLSKAGSPWGLDVAFAVAGLGKDEFAEENLGGQLQFVSSLGLGYRFDRRLSLGYRFLHMSNANLEEPNPGLDMHVLELGVRF